MAFVIKELDDKVQGISQKIEQKYIWKVKGKGKIIRNSIKYVQDSSSRRRENSEKEIIRHQTRIFL